MSDTILIEGLPPYDGEYELDTSYFTMRELREIYRISGMRGIEIGLAILESDARIVVALAALAFDRAGKPYDVEDFWDARAGKIKYVEEGAGEADPPAQLPPNESGGSEDESDKSDPPGLTSKESSTDSQEIGPSLTGDLTSDPSDPSTSTTSLPGNSSPVPST